MHLARVAVLAMGVALLVAAAALARSAQVTRVGRYEAGNLVIFDRGGISPEALPRHRQAPIAADLHGKIATKDGSPLPAARELNINFDRTLELNAKGLPACSASQLEARSTAEARRVCADAIVGTGTAEVEVAFPEQEPFRATGPLVAFNGGVDGKTTLLFVHAYIDVPAPTAVVVEARITNIDDGPFGMNALVEIPPIAGGAGSVTSFDLKLGRRFKYRGKRVSYLTARCPTGHYRIEGHVRFSEGTVIRISHLLPCTPLD